MTGDNDTDTAIVLNWGKSEEDSLAPRARNHTVMLTPELTQEVRARIQAQVDDAKRHATLPAPSSKILDQSDWQKLEEVSEKSQQLSTQTGGMTIPGQQPIRPLDLEPGAHSPLFDGSRPRGSAPARRDTLPLAGIPSPITHQPEPQQHQPQPLLDLDPQPQLNTPKPPVAYQEGVSGMDGSIHWARKTPIVGFLVSFDKDHDGEVLFLRSGRLVVTSEVNVPLSSTNALVLGDPKVSLNHAVLRISATGEIQLLDQLSEFGTHIKRIGEEQAMVLSGDKCSIEHGDLVTFGERTFQVCLLPPRTD